MPNLRSGTCSIAADVPGLACAAAGRGGFLVELGRKLPADDSALPRHRVDPSNEELGFISSKSAQIELRDVVVLARRRAFGLCHCPQSFATT